MIKLTALIASITIMCTAFAGSSLAEKQDRESMAMDSTATQWSFQFAHNWMPNYYDDIVNGAPRPAGLDNYAQLRIVAPIPMESFTLLPRLTFRHYEAANGDSGFGNTELFGLIVPKSWDWGTGRVGLKGCQRRMGIRLCGSGCQHKGKMVLRPALYPVMAIRQPRHAATPGQHEH